MGRERWAEGRSQEWEESSGQGAGSRQGMGRDWAGSREQAREWAGAGREQRRSRQEAAGRYSECWDERSDLTPAGRGAGSRAGRSG